MKNDDVTFDMLTPGSPGVRQRGRPASATTPRTLEEKRKAAALRKAKSRAARSETHGALTVELPRDVLEKFRAWCAARSMDSDETQDQVIERLIRGQLLRKR